MSCELGTGKVGTGRLLLASNDFSFDSVVVLIASFTASFDLICQLLAFFSEGLKPPLESPCLCLFFEVLSQHFFPKRILISH